MLNNVKQPVPIENILPFENSFSIKNTSSLQTKILSLLQKGNIPFAEIYIRIVLSRNPNDPYALNFLGWISSALSFYEIAIFYFEKALEKDNKWELPHENINIIKTIFLTPIQDFEFEIKKGIKKYIPGVSVL